MIHRLMVLDKDKSVGHTLFNNNELTLNSDLLIGLVQALILLSRELGPAKGDLREVELGKYQIGIFSRDNIAYVVIQDSYDSEPFTMKIINLVIQEFHNVLVKSNFNQRIDNFEHIVQRVGELLQTMIFPKQLLPEVRNLVHEFQTNTKSACDTFFIADLDDGVVEIFNQPENDSVIKILMEILSEIPFERHWLGETKLREPKVINDNPRNHEAWLIFRIGKTDFCYIGRAFFNPGQEREQFISKLDELTRITTELLQEKVEE